MMHVLAAGLEIDDSQLDELRWRCVQEVKKTNGGIKFKNVLQEHDNGGVRLKQTLYKSYDDLPLMRRWRQCWASAGQGPTNWCGARDSLHDALPICGAEGEIHRLDRQPDQLVTN